MPTDERLICHMHRTPCFTHYSDVLNCSVFLEGFSNLVLSDGGAVDDEQTGMTNFVPVTNGTSTGR